MSGVVFDANGRDANGAACCEVCHYPYRGLKCDNPGCFVNMSPERRAAVEAKIARDSAEEAERARIREIRLASFSRNSCAKPSSKRKIN